MMMSLLHTYDMSMRTRLRLMSPTYVPQRAGGHVSDDQYQKS